MIIKDYKMEYSTHVHIYIRNNGKSPRVYLSKLIIQLFTYFRNIRKFFR